MSTPSKPYVERKFKREEKKADCAVLEAAKFEKVAWVGPGSLNDHPPIEIQVLKPGFLPFSAVNRRYRSVWLASIGTTAKVFGSM
jgi:hypothetical protein